MAKLSFSQIDDSYEADNYYDELDYSEFGNVLDLPSLEKEIDETAFRNTYQRKEIRTKKKRDEGELVGSGNIRKHRKY